MGGKARGHVAIRRRGGAKQFVVRFAAAGKRHYLVLGGRRGCLAEALFRALGKEHSPGSLDRMVGGRELRSLGPDETISVTVLHGFLLSALRHDAIYDALIERMTFQADARQLDPEGLAIVLPGLISDLFDVVGKEDWIAVADLLIRDAHEELDGGEAR